MRQIGRAAGMAQGHYFIHTFGFKYCIGESGNKIFKNKIIYNLK
jgi:hypothetical protein